MNLPTRGAVGAATCPHSHGTPESHPHGPQACARGRGRVLDRAYPLAKQLAEILELELPEIAEDAKALRRRIAAALSSTDGR